MNSGLNKKSYRILVSDPVDQSLLEGLGAKGHEVDYKPEIGKDELRQILHSYDAVVVRSRTKLTSELLLSGNGLRIIARAGIGTDNIDMEAARKNGIQVLTAAGSSTDSVAELNLALLIDLSRKISFLNRQIRDGRFRKALGTEVSGKTAGIIGFGRIGHQTAKYLRTIGLNILAYDILENPELMGNVQGNYVPLDRLLELSDYVFVSVTLLNGAQELLGEEQIRRMKRGAILINTSRAEVVNLPALVNALKDGRIGGYGADVLWNEPPDSALERELVSMDSVIITPHIGAQTYEAQERVAKMTLDNLLSALEGFSQ